MKILGPKDIGHGLLIEYDAGHLSPQDNVKVIKEMKNSEFSDEVYMYCILQKYGTPNRNGRVYPKRILERENDRYQDVIKRGSAISELNHPESSLIDLERTSHVITETFWDGNKLMGRLKLLTTPGYHQKGIVSSMGDIAANLLRQGITLGISSRGVGSLKKSGEHNEVQDDFELICFDLVSSPSTPGSYLFKDMSEVDNYDEVLETVKEKDSFDSKIDRSLSLMDRLDNFLNH
jgi:hypothetical protein|tara:strand:+ start:1298 stop:1999 length:702 start_codon:yes stop_codon:yes gene_type:complete